MNQEQNPELQREQSQEMDYRLVQRLFYCYQCSQHFKKLLPRSETPICPKCNQEFIEEVTTANKTEFEQMKNPEKEAGKDQFKERDHDEGYRMVFNNPEAQQAYQTRLNPRDQEVKTQEQQQPRPQPQSSFVQYSTTTVNGVPVRQQVVMGAPQPPQGQVGGAFADPFGSLGFFNIFDSMNQIFSQPPQRGVQMQVGGSQPSAQQASQTQESQQNAQSNQQQGSSQPAQAGIGGGFPFMGFPFGGGLPLMGGMNNNFFNLFAMPDMSQFMGFNPTNFRQNYNSNFRSSGDFMFDLAQYLSEMEAANQPTRATSKETLKKLPEIEIDEAHCKKGDDGKLELPSCTVCQEEFALGNKGMLLPCGHIFHKDCLTPWLTSHNTCPVCRFELPVEE